MPNTLTISLTGQVADDVRAAAAARGLSPEDFVRQKLAFHYNAQSEAMRRLHASFKERRTPR